MEWASYRKAECDREGVGGKELIVKFIKKKMLSFRSLLRVFYSINGLLSLCFHTSDQRLLHFIDLLWWMPFFPPTEAFPAGTSMECVSSRRGQLHVTEAQLFVALFCHMCNECLMIFLCRISSKWLYCLEKHMVENVKQHPLWAVHKTQLLQVEHFWIRRNQVV